MNPLSLSIVIPTHNTRELVLQCLDSLGAGGVIPTEIVVVDDASTDRTAEAIRRQHPRVVVLESRKNLGFGAAVNFGAERTTGDIVLVLNSDTEMMEGGLAALCAAFADDESLGIAGAELLNPDGSAQWRAGRWPDRRWLFAQASGLGAVVSRLPGRGGGTGSVRTGDVDWVSGAALAVRREVWASCGPFDVDYAFYCQDLDLCWCAHRAGHRVAVIPGFAVKHHHGATIAARPGAAGSFHPAHLWTDLVRFTAKHHGPEQARRAAATLRAGARTRLFGRALSRPLAADRDVWDRDTEAFREGLRAIGNPG